MKKIIGIIHPFDMYQTFYVYEDGNELELTQVRMNDIPDTILELSKIYDVYQIDLSGSNHYTQNIIKQIKEKEATKYNENKLIITSI
jgi:hypothetical protein